MLHLCVTLILNVVSVGGACCAGTTAGEEGQDRGSGSQQGEAVEEQAAEHGDQVRRRDSNHSTRSAQTSTVSALYVRTDLGGSFLRTGYPSTMTLCSSQRDPDRAVQPGVLLRHISQSPLDADDYPAKLLVPQTPRKQYAPRVTPSASGPFFENLIEVLGVGGYEDSVLTSCQRKKLRIFGSLQVALFVNGPDVVPSLA
jgi:hypothetical protein